MQTSLHMSAPKSARQRPKTSSRPKTARTDKAENSAPKPPKPENPIPMHNVPEIFMVDTSHVGGGQAPLIKRKVALDVLQGMPPPRIAALEGVRFARVDQPPDILQLDQHRRRRSPSRSSSRSNSDSSTSDIDVEEEVDCKTRCWAAAKFALTNCVLFILVVVYVVGGTLMFQQLEQDNERAACATVRSGYVSVLNTTNLKLLAISTAGLTNDATLSNFEVVLNEFANQVISLGSYSLNANCSTIGDETNPSAWNFPNAMLFCMTIVSTIGYGQITPKTTMGKVAVICYGTIGIPLMLIFLANLGNLMSDYFKKMYSNVCCCKWCDSGKPESKKKHLKNNDSEKTDASMNQQNGADNAAFDTTSAINNDPLNGMGDHPLRPITAQFVRPLTAAPDQSVDMARPETGKSAMTDVGSGSDSEEEEENMEPGIPSVVGLALIVGYVFAGSFIFSGIQNWDTISSAYFCFVTMATIGFGDYYPGLNLDMGQSYVQTYMALSSIYIVLGMACISMCLNMLSEEMTMKVAWLYKVLKCKKCRKKKEEPKPAEPMVNLDTTSRPRTATNGTIDEPFTNDTQELITERPASARSMNGAGAASRPASASRRPLSATVSFGSNQNANKLGEANVSFA